MWKEGVEFRRMIQYIWLKLYDFAVTSYTEVWIEICAKVSSVYEFLVTSYTEVWIEILYASIKLCRLPSLPTRKCGLKYSGLRSIPLFRKVTSYTEVWIEIYS